MTARRLAPILALSAFALNLTPLAAAAGGLSKSEWNGLKSQAAQAIRDDNVAALEAILEAMAKDDSKRAVVLIAKVLSKAEGPDAQLAFNGAQTGLEGMRSAKAFKAQRDQALKAKDWRARIVMLDVLGRRLEPDDVKVLTESVKKERDPIVATTAIRLICDKRIEEGVDALLDRMEKLDKNQKPPFAELRMSLSQLLAKNLESGGDARSWWTVVKGNGGLKSVSNADRKRYAEELSNSNEEKLGTAVRLFGTEIVCTRIVFVLDRSGSMDTLDPSDGRSDPPVSSAPRGNDPTQSDDPKKNPNTRMNRAKRELQRVIKALPASMEINIIEYSSGVRKWKDKGLVKLTAKNKADAIKWVGELTAEGVTATDSALRNALEVDGARCVYLLSDGKPSMGPGADIDPQLIYKLVDEKNKILKMRIFTLGFQGADQGFMRELAKRNGGRYSDIR